METMEESRSMSSTTNNDGANLLPIIKGKRTKRHRGTTTTTTTTSSSTSSSDFSGTTTTTNQEEEDMANCLILLAQGGHVEAKPEKFMMTSRKLITDVYECKTCNKCFPSFQALGGHRASHKKPKLLIAPVMITAEEKNSKPAVIKEEDHNSSFFKPVVPSSRSRVHECSICGSEFSSGQALGGHMRRHRPLMDVPVAVPEMKRERALLSLDLNLPPAPSEDSVVPAAINNFPFASKQPLAFSLSTALVDCHY